MVSTLLGRLDPRDRDPPAQRSQITAEADLIDQAVVEEVEREVGQEINVIGELLSLQMAKVGELRLISRELIVSIQSIAEPGFQKASLLVAA